jgi:hypothetical protein
MTQDVTRVTEARRKKVAKHFGLIHGRLGECHAAFMLFKEIEEVREKSPFLMDPNVRYGEFWREVHFCALSKVIVDIGALVDRGKDTATLYSLYDLCVEVRSEHCIDAKRRIDAVRQTWYAYRSKLIAHTDDDRNSLIQKFREQGFTLVTIKSEIDELTYAFTILHATLSGMPVPTFEDAMKFESGFVAIGERVRCDTKAFLEAVDPHLPKYESATNESAPID